MTTLDIIVVTSCFFLCIIIAQGYVVKYHRYWHEYYRKQRDEQDVYIRQLKKEIYDNLSSKN